MSESAYPRLIPVDPDGYLLPDRSELILEAPYPRYVPVDVDGSFLIDGSDIGESQYMKLIPVDDTGIVQGGSGSSVGSNPGYPVLVPVDSTGVPIAGGSEVTNSPYQLFTPVDANGAILYDSTGDQEVVAIKGLIASNNTTDATNDIDISSGVVEINSRIVRSTETFTKRLDAEWAEDSGSGGLFSGTKANSTTYHLFAMRNTSTGAIDFGFDTDATGANKPSGWDVVRIWSVITNGSGVIIPFTQYGDYCEWVSPVEDISATINATAALYALSVPSGISVRAEFNVYCAGGSDYIYLTSPAQTNAAADFSTGRLNNQTTQTFMQRFTNTSRQVRIDAATGSTTTTKILTYGYTDYSRGQ